MVNASGAQTPKTSTETDVRGDPLHALEMVLLEVGRIDRISGYGRTRKSDTQVQPFAAVQRVVFISPDPQFTYSDAGEYFLEGVPVFYQGLGWPSLL